MTLYEVNEQLLNCIKVSDEEYVDGLTGELIDTEAIESLKLERTEKIENLGRWYKNLLSDASQLKEEEQRLKKRREQAEKKAESIKNYIQSVLEEGEKPSSTAFKIGWRKSTKVEYKDIKDIPYQYLKVKEPEVDKTAIKKAITSGETVEGAWLVENNNMSIS